VSKKGYELTQRWDDNGETLARACKHYSPPRHGAAGTTTVVRHCNRALDSDETDFEIRICHSQLHKCRDSSAAPAFFGKDGAMRWVDVCRSERGCGQCAHHHRGRESCRVGHSTAAFLEGFCRLWARKSEPQLHCMTLACHTTEARMSHTRRQAAHNKQRTRCMCRRAPLTVLTPSAFVAFVDAARVASERRWVVSHDISLCPFGKHVCSRWRTARQRSQSCACLDLLATVQTTGANVTTLSL
jgi:hypothetical protein